MASWVGCFFSSSSARLLEAPSYLANILTPSALPPTNSTLLGNAAALSRQSTLSSVNTSYLLGVVVPLAAPTRSEFPVAQLLPAVAIAQSNWFETVEAFFKPTYKTTQSASFTATALINSTTELSVRSNSLNYFLDAFQGALGGLQGMIAKVNVTLPLVVVVPVKGNQAARTQKGISSCVSALAVGTKSSSPQRWQIWVQGCLVAELPDQVQAQAMVVRLDDLFQSGQFSPAHLHPTKVNGMLAGKMGDRILFIIDPVMAAQLDDSPELAAIEWINNLRIALGEDPLPLAEAQVKMHHLYESGGVIGGMASWYGPYFHGRQTATGEIFDQEELTAAHPSLPFNTYLKVRNLKNGKSVVVRVNDRGPYFDNRVLDLSHRAARCIGSDAQGVVPIEATILAIDPTPEKAPVQTVARI